MHLKEATQENRIDAEHYKKEYLEYDKLLCGRMAKDLREVTDSIQNFGAYSLCNYINFVKSGIPFLMVQDIGNNVINWNINRFVDEASHKMLFKSHCRKNQVLMPMAGSLGNAAVYDKDFICSSNQAIAKITPSKGLNSYYLSTYLSSKFGRYQILKYQTATAQPNINMGFIGNIRIPILSASFQEHVAGVVKEAHLLLDKASEEYRVVEATLLKELGFDGWTPTEESVSVKNCSDFMSAGRFDAEYFQPKYDELFTLLAKCKVRVLGGKDGLVDIKRSIEPGSDAYSDKGIPFVRIADFIEMGVASPEIHIPPELCADSPRPKKDTILLSKDGSVGIAYKVEEDLDVVTSSGILHLTVKDNAVLPDYLTLVFNSKIVRLQAERSAGGSIIQHWKQSEIENVLIPILPMSSQQKITAKVRESFALRAESKRLLDLAKHAVEVAIEQGEEKAMEALEKEIGHAN